MTVTLEIQDRDARGACAVELRELLQLLELTAKDLSWRIYELEGVGDITSRWPEGVVEVGQRVDASPKGEPFAWEDLKALAALLDDVWNFRAVGTSEGGVSIIEVQIIDSTTCKVVASDPSHLESIAKRYTKLRWCPSS